jgi:DNA-binding MarR family transcriptional regulator
MSSESSEYDVVWLIRRLFRSMASVSSASLEDLGITAADRAVMEFLYPDERLSVPDIAERYDVSRQHVQVTANRLQDAGFLESQPNPRHKRSRLLALTETGRHVFAEVRRRDAGIVERAFEGIPANDVASTRRTLERLRDALNEEAR